jgi:AcrR family transcriptional regulator
MAVRAVRTQQQRSQITRGYIIEGAILALVNRGYQGATTPIIAQFAEVSQGALFRHFANKATIVIEAVEALLARFVSDFRDEVKALRDPYAPDLKARVAVAVRALWSIFRRPEMVAVFEVYLAAHTDRELEHALKPVLEKHQDAILDEARTLFHEISDEQDFISVVNAVVYAMQGCAVSPFANPGGDDELRDFFERLALRELDAAVLHRARV